MIEVGRTNQVVSVFISHSHFDRGLVDVLADKLDKSGVKVWVDRSRLRGGQDWATQIEQAILGSDILIVALTPQANASIWVRREIAFAQQANKPIIPVLLKTTGLPILIAEAQWVDFRTGVGADDSLRELLTALQEAHAHPQSFRASSIALDSLPRNIAPTAEVLADDPPAQVVDLPTRFGAKPLPLHANVGAAPQPAPVARHKRRGRGVLRTLTIVLLLVLTATVALTLLDTYSPNWPLNGVFRSAQATATPVPTAHIGLHATATTAPANATTPPTTATAGPPTVTPTAVPPTSTTFPATAITTAPPGNPGSPLWSYRVGQQSAGSPSVANGVVFVGSDDHHLYALRANTGILIWKYTTGNNIVTVPAAVNGVVYVTSTDHYISALRVADGSLIWSYRTGYAIESSPTVVNGEIYFGSDDHYVYALRAGDGALMWKYKTANNIVSAPAVYGNVVYVTSTDHYVSAIGATSGSLIWSYRTGNAITGAPAVANGVVYVGSEDGNVYALRAADGAAVWRATIATGTNALSAGRASRASGEGPPNQVNSPTVVNGVVYITDTVFSFSGAGFSSVSNVEALRTTDGSVLWKVQNTGVTPFDSDTAPTVTNEVVYTGFTYYTADFNATGSVTALRATDGSLVWRFQDGGFGLSGDSPAAANGVVYITSADGKVYALHA